MALCTGERLWLGKKKTYSGHHAGPARIVEELRGTRGLAWTLCRLPVGTDEVEIVAECDGEPVEQLDMPGVIGCSLLAVSQRLWPLARLSKR